MVEPGERTARSSRRGDWWTVLAIVLAFVTVSVPLLSGVARRENERDAASTAELLARALLAAESPGEDLVRLLEVDPVLRRRLTDVQVAYAAQRGLLRRHGYVFDTVRDEGGSWSVRARPWTAGRTGRQSFLCRPGESPRSIGGDGGAGVRAAPPQTPK